jgi:hypothetical protein
LAMIVAAIAPAATGSRARGPSAMRTPEEMPAAGQNTATPSGWLAMRGQAAPPESRRRQPQRSALSRHPTVAPDRWARMAAAAPAPVGFASRLPRFRVSSTNRPVRWRPATRWFWGHNRLAGHGFAPAASRPPSRGNRWCRQGTAGSRASTIERSVRCIGLASRMGGKPMLNQSFVNCG